MSPVGRVGCGPATACRNTRITAPTGTDRGPFAKGPCVPSSAYVLPPLMLLASNVFMTFAWYGHLRFTDRPLWLVVMVSWGIAFFEYWLAVPANRFGHAVYNTAELKTMQEVITLTVFVGFSLLYLKEPVTLSQGIGFALIGLGAFFVFKAP